MSGCAKCGGPKPAGRGRRLCEGCKEAPALKVDPARVATRFIVDDFGTRRAYRRCSDCRSFMARTDEHFSVRARAECGAALKWDTLCRRCRNARNATYRHGMSDERKRELCRARTVRINADPDRLMRERARKAAFSKRVRKARPEYHRAQARAYYKRMVADPERYARMRENARIAYRLREERAGRVVAPGGRHAVARWRPMENGWSDRRMPSGPFRAWLLAVRARGEHSMSLLTGESERHARGISRVLGGAQSDVTIATADAALSRYGLPVRVPELGVVEFLWDLWPELA